MEIHRWKHFFCESFTSRKFALFTYLIVLHWFWSFDGKNLLIYEDNWKAVKTHINSQIRKDIICGNIWKMNEINTIFFAEYM